MTDYKKVKLEELAIDVRQYFHENLQSSEYVKILNTEDVKKDELNAITAVAKLSSRYSIIGFNQLSRERFLHDIIDDIFVMLAEPRGIPPPIENTSEQNNKDDVSKKSSDDNNYVSSGGIECPKCGHTFTP